MQHEIDKHLQHRHPVLSNDQRPMGQACIYIHTSTKGRDRAGPSPGFFHSMSTTSSVVSPQTVKSASQGESSMAHQHQHQQQYQVPSLDLYLPPSPDDDAAGGPHPQPCHVPPGGTYHPAAPYQVFVVNPQGGAAPVSVSSSTAVQPTATVSGSSVPQETAAEPTRATPTGQEASLCTAYIFALGLGFMGAHHYYLRRYRFGILYTCTLGLFGIGYVVDWLRVPVLVKDYNKRVAKGEQEYYPADRTLCDAYLLWFPLGLFGEVHLGYVLNGYGTKCM